MSTTFPILVPRAQRAARNWVTPTVPFGFVAQFRNQLKKNHGQTVERLAERGGLGWDELYAASLGFSPWDGKHMLPSVEDCETMCREAGRRWSIENTNP